MRMLLLAAIAASAFVVTMAESSNDAHAIVCAAGVYHAGCATSRGAVVVGRPAAPRGAVCRRYGLVGGVRRCILY
jgi:hypothetical protein